MTIPLSARFDILQRDGFTCRYCGRQAPETELEVDHVHPRSKGGTDDQKNLVTTCRDCNRGKGDRIVPLPQKEDGWRSLEGKFFHIFRNHKDHRCIQEQGSVVADMGGGYYVVDIYDWSHGFRAWYGTRVVNISQIASEQWVFYGTDQAMREAYKYGGGECPEWRERLAELMREDDGSPCISEETEPYFQDGDGETVDEVAQAVN